MIFIRINWNFIDQLNLFDFKSKNVFFYNQNDLNLLILALNNFLTDIDLLALYDESQLFLDCLTDMFLELLLSFLEVISFYR